MITVSVKLTPAEMAKYIDHTYLKPQASLADIRKICDEAKAMNTASVCVNPSYIKLVAQELEGTDFRSNEQMTDYYVSNSKGAFPVSDVDKKNEEVPKDTAAAVAATLPTGEKAGRIMPTAPNKQIPKKQQGHWK